MSEDVVAPAASQALASQPALEPQPGVGEQAERKRAEQRRLVRVRRNGAVVMKQPSGFPLSAKLHDISQASVRSNIEIPVTLGKDYLLEVQVYLGGKHYVFACMSTCVVCTLSGRGFLVECQFKGKMSDEMVQTLSEILNR